MITFPPRRKPSQGPGYTWVKSHTSTPDIIRDVFGARPFSAHIATVGYDYDFHRGIDVPFAALGDPVYAGMNGIIIRKHHTHYDFATSGQLAKWSETDAGSAAVFAINSAVHSYLILAYSDGDKVTMNVGFYYMANAGGRLAGTVLSGVMYERTGLIGCLAASAGFAAAAAVLALLLPRAPDQAGDMQIS